MKLIKRISFLGFCILLIFIFKYETTYAEIRNPYVVDEKPQVLFADSIATSTYMGLENYEQDYIGDYAHISYTYTHNSLSYSFYSPIISVSGLDPRVNLVPNLKATSFAYFFYLNNESDWYLIDIQFDSNGYRVVVKRAGETVIHDEYFPVIDLTDTDWVYLANHYPIGDSPNQYSMSFTPVPLKNTPQPAGGSNILFIPGVLSSRLYEDSSWGEEDLWLATDDEKHQRLSLDENGKSINQVYTKDDAHGSAGVIDEILGANIYKSFISDLKKWKNEDQIINDFAIIPYDWRLSLSDIITNGATTTGGKLSYLNTQNFSESYILKKLQELVLSSKSGKVTIIAHSNGGLVTKALMQKLKDINSPLYYKVDKIIFVAVPQVGTPDAVATLLHGSSLGYGIIMTNQRSRQLTEDMSSVYNLLPSSGYFTTVNPAFAVDKVVTFENDPLFNDYLSQYGVYISNNTELKNYILGVDGRVKPDFDDTDSPNIGNSSLYSQAVSVHQILDSWQPASTTKVIQVAGWGEETLAGLEYVVNKNYLSADSISFKFNKVVDGDGTVVVPSAMWMSTSTPNIERWWVDLDDYNSIFSPNLSRIHRDILEIPNLRNFIKSEILGNIFIDSDNIVVSNTSTLSSDGTRLHYTLHSPLTLGVVDSQNRYTGLDPVTHELREEIPGVKYRKIGEVQYISISKEIPHTLKLSGYNMGSFSLDLDEQQGNVLTELTSFQGIPTSNTTEVTMNYVPNLNIASSTLDIDQDGNGSVDISLNTKLGGVVTMPKYKWSGFSQPIDDTKYYQDLTPSVFKAGSIVPVKFQLKNLNSEVVQAPIAPKWLSPEKLSSLTATVDESTYSLSATSGSDFKWDSVNEQYIYNWNTKGLSRGYWYKLSVKLDDGYIYSVIVGLR